MAGTPELHNSLSLLVHFNPYGNGGIHERFDSGVQDIPNDRWVHLAGTYDGQTGR